MVVFGNLAITGFLEREKGTEFDRCGQEGREDDDEEAAVPLKLTFKIAIAVWVGSAAGYVFIYVVNRFHRIFQSRNKRLKKKKVWTLDSEIPIRKGLAGVVFIPCF